MGLCFAVVKGLMLLAAADGPQWAKVAASSYLPNIQLEAAPARYPQVRLVDTQTGSQVLPTPTPASFTAILRRAHVRCAEADAAEDLVRFYVIASSAPYLPREVEVHSRPGAPHAFAVTYERTTPWAPPGRDGIAIAGSRTVREEWRGRLDPDCRLEEVGRRELREVSTTPRRPDAGP